MITLELTLVNKIINIINVTTDTKNMNTKDFVNRLEMCCKQKGITRTQFAHDFGIPESTIRNWLRNGNFPSAKILYNMAQYFGVPMEYLLTGDETKLDDTDFVMLLKFMKLSPEKKKIAISLIETLGKAE